MLGNLNHPTGQGINKVTIMRNEHQGPLVAFQGLQKNLLGSQVKVVGRFIQQQKVGRFKQQDCQGQTVAFSTGEDGNLLVHIIAMKKKRAQQVADLRHHIERCCPGDLLKDRQFWVKSTSLVLGKICHDQIMSFLTFTFEGGLNTGQQAHHGRLASTIGTNQSDAFTTLDGKFDLFKHCQVTIAMGHFGKAYRHSDTFRWRRERKTYLFPLRRQLNPLDLFQLLDPALHQSSLVGVITKFTDKCFQT
jgi:hypothetical protein